MENEGSSSDDSVLFPPRRQTTDNLDELQHIFDSNECKVLSTKNFPAKLSRRSRFCHVCKYELRNDVHGGVVACTTHGVRLCTKIHPPRNLDQRTCLVKLDNTPVTDWSWTCQTTDSCWNRFHTFYAPKGLFKT